MTFYDKFKLTPKVLNYCPARGRGGGGEDEILFPIWVAPSDVIFLRNEIGMNMQKPERAP